MDAAGWPGEVVSEVFAQRLALAVPLVAVTAVAWVVSSGWNRLPKRARAVGEALLVGAALAWGLKQAVSVLWLADDAFISFRYAEHFAAGDGFVFNVGERVEGYTNFLLVLALGLVRLVGGSVPHAALGLDLLAFVTLVVVAAALPATGADERPFPWAALGVALARPFHVFATSGLESEVALALVAVGVLLWRRERLVGASVLLGLGAMTRPDHLLLAGAVWAAAFATSPKGSRLQRCARLALPALGLFTAWWAWRWWYFGDFFPNTFYAKSGGGAYWHQGYVYLTHGLLGSGVAAPLLLVLVGLVALPRGDRRWPLVALSLAIAATHGVYVTRVGGDFMEYRFLLPSLFFALVAWAGVADGVAERLAAKPARVAWLLAPALCLGLVAQEVHPVGRFEKRWFLAAEETFWPVERVFPLTITHGAAKLGHELHDAFAGTGVQPKFATGAIGAAGYFAGLPITDPMGLTCRAVARQAVTIRGRPGHEKFATPDQMYDDGAVFSDAPVWPDTRDTLQFTIAGRPFWLIHHDDALEALARARGWRYPDFDALLDAALDGAESPQALEAQRALYEKLLRGTRGADVRLARLTAAEVRRRLVESTLSPAQVPHRLRQAEAFGLDDLAQSLRTRVAARFDFEDDARPGSIPDAFWPPAAGTLAHQTPVSGFHREHLLNTYAGGDATTGRAELPLPAVPEGGWVGLLVGGGEDCTHKRVALVDGAREVAHWCGVNSEHLRAVGASLDGLAAPKLVLEDEDTGAWGHLLLDDVVVVGPPPVAAVP